jgi:hypothetical protein
MNKVRLAAYKQEEVIDLARVKKDSDDILEILRRTSAVDSLNLTGLDFWLRKEGRGPLGAPIWRVDVFAVKSGETTERRVGWAEIHAETGQILRMKLDPARVAAEPKQR